MQVVEVWPGLDAPPPLLAPLWRWTRTQWCSRFRCQNHWPHHLKKKQQLGLVMRQRQTQTHQHSLKMLNRRLIIIIWRSSVKTEFFFAWNSCRPVKMKWFFFHSERRELNVVQSQEVPTENSLHLSSSQSCWLKCRSILRFSLSAHTSTERKHILGHWIGSRSEDFFAQNPPLTLQLSSRRSNKIAFASLN